MGKSPDAVAPPVLSTRLLSITEIAGEFTVATNPSPTLDEGMHATMIVRIILEWMSRRFGRDQAIQLIKGAMNDKNWDLRIDDDD